MDMDINYWCCLATDSNMALRGQLGLSAHHGPRWWGWPLKSVYSFYSSISLYNAQAIPLLFLSHPSITCTYIVEALTASWLLQLARPWVMSSICFSWCGGNWVSLACLCQTLESKSVGVMVVHRSLSVFLLPLCTVWF